MEAAQNVVDATVGALEDEEALRAGEEAAAAAMEGECCVFLWLGAFVCLFYTFVEFMIDCNIE